MGEYYSRVLIMAAVAIFFTDVPNFVNSIAANTNDSAPMFWIIGFGILFIA